MVTGISLTPGLVSKEHSMEHWLVNADPYALRDLVLATCDPELESEPYMLVRILVAALTP